MSKHTHKWVQGKLQKVCADYTCPAIGYADSVGKVSNTDTGTPTDEDMLAIHNSLDETQNPTEMKLAPHATGTPNPKAHFTDAMKRRAAQSDTGTQELRAALALTKTFNYNVYHGQDITNKCIPFEEALDELEALINARITAVLEEEKKKWHKRSDDSPYTKSWIAKQLGVSRPYLNKLLEDPDQFTIGMVKKLEALHKEVSE